MYSKMPWRLIGVACLLLASVANNTVHAYSEAQLQQIYTSEDTQIRNLRRAEIDQLRIVLGRRFDESRKPDLLARLAELYIEEYRFLFAKENQLYQKLRAQDSVTKSSAVQHSLSKKALMASIEVCLGILKSKHKPSKPDQVYYFLGYNYLELNDRTRSNQYFQQLVSVYPRSEFAAEAYRNLGDAAFEAKDYRKALQNFERAAQYPQTPSYGRVLYKLAWAYYRNRQFDRALATMRRLVEISKNNAQFVSVREEALNDLAFFFSEASRMSEAKAYFAQVSPNDEFYVSSLSRLSQVYLKRGERSKAAAIEDILIRETKDRSPGLTLMVLLDNVETAAQKGLVEDELTQLKKLEAFIGAANSLKDYTDRVQKQNDLQAKLNDRVQTLEGYIRTKALSLHKAAQKAKKPYNYDTAANYYQVYLRLFGGELTLAQRQEIETYYVDNLLAVKRTDEAFKILERSLFIGGVPALESKYAKEAAITLINLYIQKIDSTKNSDATQNFVVLAEAFIQKFPNEPLTKDLEFKLARLDIQKRPEQVDNQNNRLIQFIEANPSRPESAEAALEMLNSQIKNKQEANAEALAQRFSKNLTLMRTGERIKLKELVFSLLERRSFADIKSLESQASQSEVALSYEKLGRQAQDKEVRIKSYRNALLYYERALSITDVLRLAALLKRDAVSVDLDTTLTRLITLAAVQFALSSEKNRTSDLAAILTNQDIKPSTRLLSVDYLAAMALDSNNFDAATQVQNRLLEICRTSKKADSIEVPCDASITSYLTLLEFKRSVSNEHRVHEARFLKHLTEHGYANRHYFEVRGRLLAAYESLFESSKASAVLAQMINHPAKNLTATERRYYVAAKIRSLEIQKKRLENLRLELPETLLRSRTKQRIEAMQNVVAQYEAVAKLRDPEGTILVNLELANIYTSFARDLERAPVPDAYQAERLQQYKQEIQKIVTPLRQKGIEFLRTAHRQGIELGQPLVGFVKVRLQLAEQQPQQFPLRYYLYSSRAFEYAKQEADIKDVVAVLAESNFKQEEAWVQLLNRGLKNGRFLTSLRLAQLANMQIKRSQRLLYQLGLIYLRTKNPIDAMAALSQSLAVDEYDESSAKAFGAIALHFQQFEVAQRKLRPLALRNKKNNILQIMYAISSSALGERVDFDDLDDDDVKNANLNNALANNNAKDVVRGLAPFDAADIYFKEFIQGGRL